MIIHDLQYCHGKKRLLFSPSVFDKTAPSFPVLEKLFGDGAGKLVNPVWFDIVVKAGYHGLFSILPFSVKSNNAKAYRIHSLDKNAPKLNWTSIPFQALDIPANSALGVQHAHHAKYQYGNYWKNLCQSNVSVTMGLFKYAAPLSLNHVCIVGMIPDDQKRWWLTEYGLQPNLYEQFERIDK